MWNPSNPNLIPRDGDEDRPHDERSSLSSTVTYAKKEATMHASSAAPKRSAQKAPLAEPDSKFSSHRPPSAASRPSLRDLRQNNQWSTNANTELLLGFPQEAVISSDSYWQGSNSQQQEQPLLSEPPPGFSQTSASTSGKYEDAEEAPPAIPHDKNETGLADGDVIANGVKEITLESVFSTTISSLQNPSDIGSTREGTQTSESGSSRSGNPRSILNERYQKKHNKSFTKKDFVTIRDSSDGDHIPLFTSVFVCFVTGECFLSGDFLQADFKVDRDGMNWYMKKSYAEFAAAGRAEDCLRFRLAESSRSGFVEQFCSESPYLKRSREEEQKDISRFLESRACDAVAYDKVVDLMTKGREK